MSFFQHPQAIVEPGASIGENTRVWAWAHVLKGAKIGADCNLCDHTFIESDVVIGDRVTIKCGVYVWDGIIVEDDVFIGPGVAFTNDKFPRSKQYPAEFARTLVHSHASIGANATILPGVEIGQYAMIGAGAVVTKNVPPYAIIQGNPGRIEGYVNAGSVTAGQMIFSGEEKPTVTGAKICKIPSFSDMRGSLGVIEWKDVPPFRVERLFYTYNVPGTEVRGEHAHKKCEQLLIALHGSLHVIADNGSVREEFLLDSPTFGLYVPAGLWGVQYKHSRDCVLLVLASEKYDASDYIRNYDEYLEYIKQRESCIS